MKRKKRESVNIAMKYPFKASDKGEQEPFNLPEAFEKLDPFQRLDRDKKIEVLMQMPRRK